VAGRGDTAWFRRHMSRYANELVEMLMDKMVEWVGYVRDVIAQTESPPPSPPPLREAIAPPRPDRWDRFPPIAGKNTNL
jgi:hypothetical protein